MNNKFSIFIAVFLAVLFLTPSLVSAETDGVASICTPPEDYVIPVVEAEAGDKGVELEWEMIDHSSLLGYKIVISKNNPEPVFSSDGYLVYITDKNVTSYLIYNAQKYQNGDFGDYLEAGEDYYFSVTALYNCGLRARGNAVLVTFPDIENDDSNNGQKQREMVQQRNDELKQIKNQVKLLRQNRLEEMLAGLKELRSMVREQQTQMKHLRALSLDLEKLAADMRSAIENFVTYGVDDNTKGLGEGERAAVVHSYKQAFGKLPTDDTELEDAIRIANGRWPSIRNQSAEDRASVIFAKIYDRQPDLENPQDNAAVTIMAYGLRQRAENRKLESERNGLKIYKAIFGHMPETTEDWNVMQAITYSGATR